MPPEPNPLVLRARPWLGTLVEIGVGGLDGAAAAAAIEAAFAEVAAVHRLMSFHCADSDVARINRAPAGATLAVDARTLDVLRCAAEFARDSAGLFDITVAPRLVARGLLPTPERRADPAARACDLELLDARHVRLRRALWIDLGGIAKGYAVDRAVDVLVAAGAAQVRVNAGGDLRVHGPRSEQVQIRGTALHLELVDGALATSVASEAHRDGRDGRAVAAGVVASVVAPTCMSADALSKIVLAGGADATALLRARGAAACRHDGTRWRVMEAA